MTVTHLVLAACCLLAATAGCLGGPVADQPPVDETVTAAPVPSPEPTPEPAVTPSTENTDRVRALHARTTLTPTEETP